MSGKAFGWARDLRGLSGGLTAKAVLLLMADYADGERSLYPSIATMAAELDASERTVQRAVNTLIADGLIEREFRTTGTGKKTSSRYVLRLEVKRPGQGLDPSECHLSDPSDCRDRGDNLTPTPRQSVTIHMNPCLEPEGADAPSAGARADEGAQAFEALVAALPAEVLDRTNVPAAKAAFPFAADEAGGPWAIVEAARAWVAAATWKRGSQGAPSLNTWLDQKRWLGRLPGREGQPTADAPAARFAGPAELRDDFVESFGEAYAATYLDPCRWDGKRRALQARTGVAVSWLGGTARWWLQKHGLSAERFNDMASVG